MLLEIKNVVAGYLPDVNVLQAVNLHVSEGELVCLIGPNGAGKSTVLRAVSGLLHPTAGQILFAGRDIGGLRPDQILHYGIAHVPQGHSSFPEMSVKENLLMGAYILKDIKERDRRMDRVYEMFPLLKERRNSQVKRNTTPAAAAKSWCPVRRRMTGDARTASVDPASPAKRRNVMRTSPASR